MQKKINLKKAPQVLTIFFYILLFAAVIFLMRHVQNLLNSDVKINLTEVVTQNKDVITSKLKLEVNNLDSIANQISDRLLREGHVDHATLEKVFSEYFIDKEDQQFFLANKDGAAIFPNGNTIDISGRRYFKLACRGIQNISDRLVSRQDGEEIFVISVPLKYRGEIIGTLQRSFSPEKMYTLCSISLFSSEGYMYIVNKEGYILVSSQNDEYNHETENYFRKLYSQGNSEASKQLQNDIEQNRAGFMETNVDDKNIFSAYTPIADIHGWYLISSVSTSAVSPNASIVFQLFYFILSVIALVFGVSLFCFLSYKNKQQANLERIAFIDDVTQGNTYNKFTVDLLDVLQKYPEKQFYLLKFDIDNFKYVNNFYGFDFGDQVLFQIYQNIDRKLLPNESIARISSDHFIVLLEDAAKARLQDLLESIQNDENVTIYFSAGLYKITDRTESINLMVDKASTAAETVKGLLHENIGRYSEKFDQLMLRNEQLKRAIKQAFTSDEIVPYYQPKININTGKMTGAEALARWQTQDGKLVSPGEFIPLCEKTGLITELDMIIFEKILLFLRRNLLDGISCVPISVNFSRLHLLDEDFFSKILAKTREYEIPPHLIELELTESAMFNNYEAILRLITQLHDSGFLISMDDFGSGYSSLNMLKDIPIDILKIDKGFLDKTTNSHKQRVIFSAITQMAQQLHIKIVVEGVEVIENITLMKETGCQIAQGYYFSKPIDEIKFEKIYRGGFEC